MDADLDRLRKTVVEKLDAYLLERQKTCEECRDFKRWKTQQYAEMQAEHAWLNAKKAYEVELYDVYGHWESIQSANS